jgi:antitoxin component of MazEF toxin-antitoxin module
MITQQIRRIGDDLVITIPDDLASRLNLRKGQTVAIDLTPMEDGKPVLRPELVRLLEEGKDVAIPVMKYLKDK